MHGQPHIKFISTCSAVLSCAQETRVYVLNIFCWIAKWLLFLNKDSLIWGEWILLRRSECSLLYVMNVRVSFSTRMPWLLVCLSEFASRLVQDTRDELMMTWHEILCFQNAWILFYLTAYTLLTHINSRDCRQCYAHRSYILPFIGVPMRFSSMYCN